MTTQLIVANWKMHKVESEAVDFVDAFLGETLPEGIDVAIAPPFTSLPAVASALRGSRVALAAQNMHWERSGAFTGEIAPDMLTDLGVAYVIVGHSERRQYFGETDQTVNKKVHAALTTGLTPIVCVGESLATRDAGGANAHVAAQTEAALAGIGADGARKVVLAYEPIWAIGTGRNCDAAEADATMRAIRASVRGLEQVRILYGGSVKADNVAAYAAMPCIDGALVGGASLDAHDFANLVRAARREASA